MREPSDDVTSDDCKCNEITDATYGLLRSLLQRGSSSKPHVQHGPKVTTRALQRWWEDAHRCGHSHDRNSCCFFDLRRRGTRDPRFHSRSFLAAVNKVEDFVTGSAMMRVTVRTNKVQLLGTPRSLTGQVLCAILI